MGTKWERMAKGLSAGRSQTMSVVAVGDWGTADAIDVAIAGEHGTALAEYEHGIAIAGDYGTAVGGARAIAGDYGTATAGYCGKAEAGIRGRAEVGQDGTAIVGFEGRAKADEGGTLMITYAARGSGFDVMENIAVGFIGCRGLKPKTWYRVGNLGNGDDTPGVFIECDDQ